MPADPIKIGFLTSQTGAAAAGGLDMLRGIELWHQQINRQLAGRPVKLIVENDEFNVETAVAKVRKLVEVDKVHLLAGTVLTKTCYTIAPLADAYQVPMVVTICSADDLTKRQRHEWVIRTSFSCSQFGLPFGDWVYNKLGYRRIITFGLDFPFGWELVGPFQQSFEAAGGTIVQKVWVPDNPCNYSPAMKQLSSDADAVFFATANYAATAAARQYKESGPRLPMIGSGTSFDESTIQTSWVLGAISVSNYSPALKTAANQRFCQQFKALHGADATISFFAEGAYTTGLWIQKAIETIEGDVEDKAKFLSALKSASLADAPRGPMKMDQYGNPIQNLYIRRVDEINGQKASTIIDTIEGVSQFWTYDPVRFMQDPPYSKDYPR